jgi:hypothetical protein
MEIWKISFALAAVDALLSLGDAMIGDKYCIFFAVLSGIMYAHGLYYMNKEKGE